MDRYCLKCEGEMELYIFNWLKTEIIRIKQLQICKEHKNNKSNGTIAYHKIKKCKNSKKTIVIMDKDDIKDINKYRDKENNDIMMIISDPCLELVLLSFFEVNDAILDKKSIEEKLNKKLSNYNIKYKHEHNDFIKIIKLFQREINKNNEKYENWKKNLKNLKKQKKSNFIDLFTFLEGYK